MTQEDPVPPTIFNIVFNVVVRATLMEVCGPQEYHHVMGWAAGEKEILFYADDGFIAGRKPIWVQGKLTTIICIIEREGI